jgi:hypothetical protein
MKRIACRFTYPTILAIAVALLAFMVLSSATPSLAASPEASKADRVEARIKELHTKLKITPAQEESWNGVAQVMRDDAKTMEALIKARSEKGSATSAVDDLKSYGEIAEAHADGLKKFTSVFEPLYAGMSDAQKKSADMLFRHHGTMKSKAKGK